ncbi:ScbR family autoregulator-binding transcription factor [Leifsonia shinshuensis]|uniref:TetR/AcrR family transcriptional regulator n=1 Tax=Leifsonia shinshuensis TaxID=150026 RepID=A0A7G6YEV1_9MICO|nr:ScbR family autoregulator-binding transcription factor [Leifsonia shinshuensis]QNE37016.1 TetR/AcrR family transcriptional regulator [Leifsonia shinshuensis]
MVTQTRALATRDAILRGAAEVFGARGYGLASISDIAKAAGLTKGALYFHFASKDELALAVVAEQHRRTMEASAAILAEGRPALESLVLLCRSLGRQLLEDPVVQAGIRLTTDVGTADQAIVEPYEDWFRAIEDLIRRAIEEGDVSERVDPAMFAHLLSPAFTGVQLVSATLTGRADLLQRLRELWIVLLPGIVAEGRLDALRGLPDLVVE